MTDAEGRTYGEVDDKLLEIVKEYNNFIKKFFEEHHQGRSQHFDAEYLMREQSEYLIDEYIFCTLETIAKKVFLHQLLLRIRDLTHTLTINDCKAFYISSKELFPEYGKSYGNLNGEELYVKFDAVKRALSTIELNKYEFRKRNGNSDKRIQGASKIIDNIRVIKKIFKSLYDFNSCCRGSRALELLVTSEIYNKNFNITKELNRFITHNSLFVSIATNIYTLEEVNSYYSFTIEKIREGGGDYSISNTSRFIEHKELFTKLDKKFKSDTDGNMAIPSLFYNFILHHHGDDLAYSDFSNILNGVFGYITEYYLSMERKPNENYEALQRSHIYKSLKEFNSGTLLYSFKNSLELKNMPVEWFMELNSHISFSKINRGNNQICTINFADCSPIIITV